MNNKSKIICQVGDGKVRCLVAATRPTGDAQAIVSKSIGHRHGNDAMKLPRGFSLPSGAIVMRKWRCKCIRMGVFEVLNLVLLISNDFCSNTLSFLSCYIELETAICWSRPNMQFMKKVKIGICCITSIWNV